MPEYHFVLCSCQFLKRRHEEPHITCILFLNVLLIYCCVKGAMCCKK
uniref:Uncharacterized protein n=1 Tax=Arundo donax TaxID=35708 RepID=A0A0A8YBF5_ARUDO